MGTVGTPELVRRLGMKEQLLYRLIYRGIIRPTGPGGSGSQYTYDEAEQRAVTAVSELMRSHLMADNKSPHAAELRDAAFRAVAEAARAPLPTVGRARWLILTADGECVRGDDWLAATMIEPRTLIPVA